MLIPEVISLKTETLSLSVSVFIQDNKVCEIAEHSDLIDYPIRENLIKQERSEILQVSCGTPWLADNLKLAIDCSLAAIFSEENWAKK